MDKLSSKLDYNEDLAALEHVLSKLARPGEFYAQGSLVTPLPKVEVNGVGVVSFPLHPAQARELAEHATLAPYGRGEETIIDPTVRRVWQFGIDQFRVGGSHWEMVLNAILSSTADGLGCDASKVRAEPYKLLLYEKDGFFLSHRDTEKTPGMFGTLVVVLPSAHTGGELVIRHAGKEAVVTFATSDVSEISYAGFYADCQHEVRPITSGNRLCLVYNLVFSAAAKERQLAPENSAAITKANELIRECLDKTGAPVKLVYLLEHQYTPEGLSFAGLKNHDRAVGTVLIAAAGLAKCALHLGIVHIEETGPAEIAYSPRSRGRWRSYRDDDEEEDENSDYVPIEISDSSRYVSDWAAADGSKPGFGAIPLAENELLPAGALDDQPPDRDRVTEATGNEGATFERSYHRAALVLWKEARYAEVLLQSGIDAVMPYFKRIVGAPNIESDELTRIAEQIIERWSSHGQSYRWYDRETEGRATRADMLDLLGKIGDADLVERFLSEVILEQFDGSENKAFTRIAGLVPPKKLRTVLTELISKYMPIAPKQSVELLSALLAAKGAEVAWRKSVLVPLCPVVIEATGRAETPDPNISYWNRPKPQPSDGPALTELYKFLLELDGDQLLALVDAIVRNATAFPPDEVISPALKKISTVKRARENPAFVLLWRHSAEFLLRRSEYPPVKPGDWARPVKLECRCEDCRELERFAADPQQQVHGFRIRQDRRSHLESAIRNHRIDISCRTEEKGSPKTLVCTKNLASYERECTRHHKDVDWMKMILPLLDTNEDTAIARTRDQMKAAIKQA